MLLRRYNLKIEGPEPIFALFDKVYGDSEAIRERWTWEWELHPEAEKIVFVVAEENKVLCGMTVRMPVTLWDGQNSIAGWFATNSMVDPAYQGDGLIKKLYTEANSLDGIHLSKGTAEAMFRQLLRMNYRWLRPDTNQICLLSPLQWIFHKIGIQGIVRNSTTSYLQQFTDYREVKLFNNLVNSSATNYWISPQKSVEWLNWRYVDIPHQTYRIAIREVAGELVSWCVLRFHGRTANLVDLDWKVDQNDEPDYTIRYTKKVARAFGAIKLMAWASAASMRSELASNLFVSRKETPYLSICPLKSDLLGGKEFFFVLGDNDTDYV